MSGAALLSIGFVETAALAALPSPPATITLIESPPPVPCTTGDCNYDPSRYSSGAILGSTASELVGYSLVSADFNRDGRLDVAIGAPGADSAAGAVYLVLGSSSGLAQVLDVRKAVRYSGTAAGTRLGTALAAGDLNGDGFPDLVMGAPATGSSTVTAAVYVVPGAATMAQPVGNVATAANVILIEEVDGHSELGTSLAIGNFLTSSSASTLDSKPDLLIGCPGISQAIALNGPLSKTIDLTSKSTTLRFAGVSDRTGQWVGVLGDLDGDGVSEVGLGAPTADNGGGRLIVFEGRTRLAFDPNLSGQITFSNPSAPPINQARTILGDLKNSSGKKAGALGMVAISGLDANGDGSNDLVFSTPLASSPDLNTSEVGRVYFLFGSSAFYNSVSTSLFSATFPYVLGAAASDQLGLSLAPGGDIDADGFSEVLIGSPLDSNSASLSKNGIVNLVPGRANASWTQGQKLDGMRLVGHSSGDQAGLSLIGSVDSNGDKIPEILVGTPEVDALASNAGGVYFVDPDDLYDRDGDGQSRAGGDCDDANVSNFFRTTGEVCDGIDNDCDGSIDAKDSSVSDAVSVYPDADLDGYGDSSSVPSLSCPKSIPTGFTTNSEDCDDRNEQVNPAASEVCDDLDNDCDKLVDEADDSVVGVFLFLDDDLDGFGSERTDPIVGCPDNIPEGYALDSGDCDDGNALVYPAAFEICNDLDDDCDGLIDDEDPSIQESPSPGFSQFYFDKDGDGFGNGAVVVSACDAPLGYASNAGDCDDSDRNINPTAPEGTDGGLGCLLSDGVDNDCDGLTDEGTCEVDDDLDGYSESAGDCNDADPTVNSNAAEICNGLDENCNTQIDEGFDQDGDGQLDASRCTLSKDATDCDDSNANVYLGAPAACDGLDSDCDGTLPDTGFSDESDQDGDGKRQCSGDCDDSDPTIYSGAPELCDGKDNNCSGQADEQIDDDKDGFTECDDCDDEDPRSYPGAAELCDGKDNNCDGQIPSTGGGSEVDSDDDGVKACQEDCNDRDDSIGPDFDELCDDKDNDCDGKTDESPVDALEYYQDSDEDGFGSPVHPIDACSAPEGYVSNDTDCNDDDANVHPGATEVCDGADNNCDNTSDQDLIQYDRDEDGFMDAAQCGTLIDSIPLDCNDLNPNVNPDAEELAGDDVDNDCDGTVDNVGTPVPLPDELVSDALSCACSTPGPAANDRPGSLGALVLGIACLGGFYRRRAHSSAN